MSVSCGSGGLSEQKRVYILPEGQQSFDAGSKHHA